MYALSAASTRRALSAVRILNNRFNGGAFAPTREAGLKTSASKRFRFDLVLIIALLLVGIAAFIIMKALSTPGGKIAVNINGEYVCEYSLSADGEYPLNGGTNILVIEGGAAYIKEASCPDGTCMHQGKISDIGERIVCLPNKVLVEVCE